MGQEVEAEETTRAPVDGIAHAVYSRHFADTLSNAHLDRGSKFNLINRLCLPALLQGGYQLCCHEPGRLCAVVAADPTGGSRSVAKAHLI